MTYPREFCGGSLGSSRVTKCGVHLSREERRQTTQCSDRNLCCLPLRVPAQQYEAVLVIPRSGPAAICFTILLRTAPARRGRTLGVVCYSGKHDLCPVKLPQIRS